MELSDKPYFIWYNIVKIILLEDFRMEETLKWVLPVVIPLIISVSTALISSKSTIKKTKEETAKEIASIQDEMANQITAQFIKSFLEPSAQGKDIKETMDRLKQLKDLADSL